MKASSAVARIIARIGRLKIVDELDLHRKLEPSHLRRLFRLYEIDCVFDVGGNQGQYARMLRRDAGFDGLIITFEPIPAAAAVLREKAARDRRWVVEEVALSDQDGQADFNIMKKSAFSSLSQPRHDEVDRFVEMNRVTQVVSVRTEMLAHAHDRLRRTHGFSRPFLKLDTQGFDTRIVSGSRGVMRAFIGLQSELAIRKLYDDSVDFREALTLYEQCGFELSAFVPNNAGHFPRLVEIDCVMIRSDLIALEHGHARAAAMPDASQVPPADR